jgi:hypothetical protein
MVGAGRVGFCIDECLRTRLAIALRELRAPWADHVRTIRELGLCGVSDEVLFAELRKLHFAALITKGSSILAASIRRSGWQAFSLSLFVLARNCGNLSLFEHAWRVIWWWLVGYGGADGRAGGVEAATGYAGSAGAVF